MSTPPETKGIPAKILKEYRAIARDAGKAYPGDWHIELLGSGWAVMDQELNEISIPFRGETDAASLFKAVHIATYDPPAIEALLDEIAHLKRQLRAKREPIRNPDTP